MIIQPDILVRDILHGGFIGLKNDPSPLPNIFYGRPNAEIADVAAYLVANNIIPELSYPRQAGHIGLFVNSSSDEDQATHYIGGSSPDDESPDNDVYGAFFNAVVRVTTVADNANLAAYFATLCIWILMNSRTTLYGQGLINQRVSGAEIVDLRQYVPDMAFGRDVRLYCSYTNTVVTPITEPPVLGVELPDITVQLPPLPRSPATIHNDVALNTQRQKENAGRRGRTPILGG